MSEDEDVNTSKKARATLASLAVWLKVAIPFGALFAGFVTGSFTAGKTADAVVNKIETNKIKNIEQDVAIEGLAKSQAETAKILQTVSAQVAAASKRAEDNAEDIDRDLRPRLRVLEQGGVRVEERLRGVEAVLVRFEGTLQRLIEKK